MSDYQDWIKKLDIDYFSAFIKAWITFNSWYRSVYTERQDRAVIEKIKNESNRFKTYINNFLEGADNSSIIFQDNIGRLHNALNNAAIVTQERGGTRMQISFTEIAVNNPKTNVDETYRINKFKIERTNATTKTIISHKTTGAVFFSFQQEAYNLDELTLHPDFVRLGEECKNQCIANYKQVRPYITENLLAADNQPRVLGGISFVNDINKISRGIVEILYLLRCSLMHGELAPDKNSSEVYRYAYEIISVILKKLL